MGCSTSIVTISTLIWVAVWQLLFPSIAAAQTTTQTLVTGETLFQDSFDDGDISGWVEQRNFQVKNPTSPCMNQTVPAQWMFQNGKLGLVVDSPSCFIEITPQQVDLSVTENFEYSVDITLSESTAMDRNILFLWQDGQNWYDVKLFAGSLEIQKVVGGKVYPPTGTNAQYPFKANQSYTFKIQFTTDTIRVLINEVVVIEAADPAPKLAGPYTIGVRTAVGAVKRSVTWYDNIRVSTLIPATQDQQLAITSFKQTDPEWKNQEYDSGTSWSAEPSIGRWGCALTSVAMILRYYEIDQLPTGQPLTPASLNQWLKDQPDGYVGTGLLNWLAVSRLTQLVSRQGNTPKLEYLRNNGADFTPAVNEILADKPVILEIPGHFLVGNGVTSTQTDLIITDPAFNYTKLSQHQQPLVSTRLFQPSQTDLSYLLVVTDPEISVTLVNANGETKPVDTYLEHITAFTEEGEQFSQEDSPQHRLTLLPKPSSDTYTLSFSQSQFGAYQADVYTYDQTGEVTYHQVSGYAGPSGNHHLLKHDTEKPSSLQLLTTFEQLRADLHLLYQNNQLTSTFDWRQWDRYTQLGSRTQSVTTKLRLTKLLLSLISRSNYLVPLAKLYLTEQLQTLLAELGDPYSNLR